MRTLIEDSLKNSGYEEVAFVAQLAEAVSTLQKREFYVLGHGIAGNTVQKGEKKHDLSEVKASADGINSKLRKVKRGRSFAYPRFERDDERLIKVGWSKKNKTEYEHKVPRAVAETIFNRLIMKRGQSKKFEVDELLPVTTKEGEEIPAYQVYATIAWLRNSAAVEKRGRDGYVFLARTADMNAFLALWQELPARSP